MPHQIPLAVDGDFGGGGQLVYCPGGQAEPVASGGEVAEGFGYPARVTVAVRGGELELPVLRRVQHAGAADLGVAKPCW